MLDGVALSAWNTQDRFCRIMSDTKKIKIKITNDHHDLKDVNEYRKLFGLVK